MFAKVLNRQGAGKGQSLLEFALVIPVLCVIFMGIFDFGWILHRQITMDNATRAAARRGAVGATTAEMTTLIQSSVYFTLLPEQVQVRVLDENHVNTGNSNDRTPDNYIEVTITLNNVQLVTPLQNFIATLGPINLSSKSEFLIE